jgi:acetoin utilization deacetylase AcuC-like enzyme
MAQTHKPAFIYTSQYEVDIGAHVFPTVKYRLIHDYLVRHEHVGEQEFLEPRPASLEELRLVHTPEYLDDLMSLRSTARTMYSELPLTEEIVQAYILCAGGSILAARETLVRRIGVHLGGGFHHAFPDHAEGFCYINDVAVAINVLLHDRSIERAFVVDCDLHQGNGTARCFQGIRNVFTFSIHQENNYPVKERSGLDIGLPDFADDELYLRELGRVIPGKVEEFKPDLVLYVAGADPYEHDQLGQLQVTMEGLRRRDEMVISCCVERGIPLAIVLAGGYAFKTEDTVQIHANTCLAALQALRQ